MANTELLHKISALLLVITGIMHLLTPLQYAMSMDVISFIIFGFIYLVLGLLLLIRDE